MRAGDEPTEFLDFASLLSAPIKGELPLLVGGHAVNVWGLIYGIKHMNRSILKINFVAGDSQL